MSPRYPFELEEVEIRMVELIADGKTHSEIAETVGLTTHMVGNRLSHVYKMLGVNNAAAAVAYLLRAGAIK